METEISPVLGAAAARRGPRLAVLRHSARALVKRSVIRAGLDAVTLSGARTLFPGPGGRGLVFTLHHVRPDPGEPFAPNAHLSVTPEFLEQAVTAALECGLLPVHLHDLPALLSDPADRRKFVAFTLDDGYRNNAEFAAPIFRRYGVPYTIFVSSGLVERTRTIWWETAEALVRKVSRLSFDFGAGPEEMETESLPQKRAAYDRLGDFAGSVEMEAPGVEEDVAVAMIDEAARRAGIDPRAIVDGLVMTGPELRRLGEDPLVHFGAHTMTHVNLRRVGADRLREEIAGSARAVEHYVGRAPRSFAYPYGFRAAAGEREALAVAEAGFAVAVTTQPGVLGPHSLQRPTYLPRVSLNGLFQKKRHVKALISGIPFRFLAA